LYSDTIFELNCSPQQFFRSKKSDLHRHLWIFGSEIVLRIPDRCLFYPGSGVGFLRISDPGFQTYIFENLMTIFWVISATGTGIFLCKLAQKIFFTNSIINFFSSIL
jgi:hypothetical protein